MRFNLGVGINEFGEYVLGVVLEINCPIKVFNAICFNGGGGTIGSFNDQTATLNVLGKDIPLGSTTWPAGASVSGSFSFTPNP